jgi:hypothetical protein
VDNLVFSPEGFQTVRQFKYAYPDIVRSVHPGAWGLGVPLSHPSTTPDLIHLNGAVGQSINLKVITGWGGPWSKKVSPTHRQSAPSRLVDQVITLRTTVCWSRLSELQTPSTRPIFSDPFYWSNTERSKPIKIERIEYHQVKQLFLPHSPCWLHISNFPNAFALYNVALKICLLPKKHSFCFYAHWEFRVYWLTLWY